MCKHLPPVMLKLAFAGCGEQGDADTAKIEGWLWRNNSVDSSSTQCCIHILCISLYTSMRSLLRHQRHSNYVPFWSVSTEWIAAPYSMQLSGTMLCKASSRVALLTPLNSWGAPSHSSRPNAFRVSPSALHSSTLQPMLEPCALHLTKDTTGQGSHSL